MIRDEVLRALRAYQDELHHLTAAVSNRDWLDVVARLERGEDPREVRANAAPKVRAFEHIGRRWHAHMLPRWTPTHASDVLASLERDVFPVIGAMPIAGITPLVPSSNRIGV